MFILLDERGQTTKLLPGDIVVINHDFQFLEVVRHEKALRLNETGDTMWKSDILRKKRQVLFLMMLIGALFGLKFKKQGAGKAQSRFLVLEIS